MVSLLQRLNRYFAEKRKSLLRPLQLLHDKDSLSVLDDESAGAEEEEKAEVETPATVHKSVRVGPSSAPLITTHHRHHLSEISTLSSIHLPVENDLGPELDNIAKMDVGEDLASEQPDIDTIQDLAPEQPAIDIIPELAPEQPLVTTPTLSLSPLPPIPNPSSDQKSPPLKAYDELSPPLVPPSPISQTSRLCVRLIGVPDPVFEDEVVPWVLPVVLVVFFVSLFRIILFPRSSSSSTQSSLPPSLSSSKKAKALSYSPEQQRRIDEARTIFAAAVEEQMRSRQASSPPHTDIFEGRVDTDADANTLEAEFEEEGRRLLRAMVLEYQEEMQESDKRKEAEERKEKQRRMERELKEEKEKHRMLLLERERLEEEERRRDAERTAALQAEAELTAKAKAKAEAEAEARAKAQREREEREEKEREEASEKQKQQEQEEKKREEEERERVRLALTALPETPAKERSSSFALTHASFHDLAVTNQASTLSSFLASLSADSRQAYLDATDDGYSAVMLAAYNGSTEALDVLLSAGGWVGGRDEGRNTSLMMACDKGHTACALLLLSHMPSYCGAVFADGPCAQNAVGQTALMVAAFEGHEGCVRALLESGVDSGIELHDGTGNTALILASDSGHADIVELLLTHAPPPQKNKKVPSLADAVDSNGNSALIYAAHRGHIDVVKELLAYKCNVDLQNTAGWTALMIASKGAKVGVVKVSTPYIQTHKQHTR